MFKKYNIVKILKKDDVLQGVQGETNCVFPEDPGQVYMLSWISDLLAQRTQLLYIHLSLSLNKAVSFTATEFL